MKARSLCSQCLAVFYIPSSPRSPYVGNRNIFNLQESIKITQCLFVKKKKLRLK